MELEFFGTLSIMFIAGVMTGMVMRGLGDSVEMTKLRSAVRNYQRGVRRYGVGSYSIDPVFIQEAQRVMEYEPLRGVGL